VTALVRSWLYAPGHHTDRVAKALRAGADAVVIDLEDSVPAARKAEARATTVATLASLPSQEQRPHVWVRINPPHTAHGQDDVAALASHPPDGVRVPRAEDASAVVSVAEALGCPLQLLVETARGLMAAQDLATAHHRVWGIGLGEADLASDLRVGASSGLDWARGWMVAVSRAAGLASPVQSVYTDVADIVGLRASTLAGRLQGFFGRSLVHPRQIAPVHDVYRPTADESARARELVAALEAAAQRGDAAVLTEDGRFVDPAVVAQAQLVLELASLDTSTPTTNTRTEENR
jgi:citrate lyase subunit beta/citryl-CoA lyase